MAAAFLVCSIGLVHADEAQDAKAVELFQKGMTAYQTGEYAEARGVFDELLSMEPGMHAALRMRDRAEMGVLLEMKQREELGPQAEALVELMMRAVREKGRTVVEPDELIAQFTSEDAEAYGNAQVALKRHGPYAVPYVLPVLQSQAPDEQHVVGRAVSLLAGMQRDACLPLIEVLRNSDDPLLRSRVAGVLGQIGDERAVPALMAAWEDEGAAQPVRRAAAKALESLTGSAPAELGSAVEQYVEFGKAYLFQRADRVGYTFGMSGDIWQWNPRGGALPQKVTYEQVPNYLFYARMAGEVALEGLAMAPDEAPLQAILGAALVRQMGLCEHFSSAEFGLGGEELAEEQREDAAARAEQFAVRVPVVLRLLSTPVVAEALELTLDAADGRASLYLVKMLGAKLAAEGGLPDAATVDALVQALDSGSKDVRYNASIVLVESCPAGTCGPPEEIMQVMSAALNSATARKALILIDDFQTRNTLADILRSHGVVTIETGVNEGSIEGALSLEPSVDAAFLSGSAPDPVFGRVLGALRQDPRTKGLPVYVVLGPRGAVADVASYEGVEAILSADDIRQAKLQPIIEGTILAESRSAFTDQEEELVLKAVRALDGMAAADTAYPLRAIEPGLTRALRGYRDEVTGAAISALASFGSEAALPPLSQVVAGDDVVELKVGACEAMAAVMARTGAKPSPDALEALKAALSEGSQPLREAAAGALAVSGLGPQEVIGLVRSEGLQRK
ncbi:MAG: HEAT repeat domain-containing protein [Candidatus Brocadiaceae bacterium]|jgi:hypothetical protein